MIHKSGKELIEAGFLEVAEKHVTDGQMRKTVIPVQVTPKREPNPDEAATHEMPNPSPGPAEDDEPVSAQEAKEIGRRKTPTICNRGGARIGTNAKEGIAVFRRAACHQWRCPVCGQENRRTFAHRVQGFIEEYGTKNFVTFTFAPSKWVDNGWVKQKGKRPIRDKNGKVVKVVDSYEISNEKAVWKEISRVWDRFLKALKRKAFGTQKDQVAGRIPYLVVPERHSSGIPHYHGLLPPLVDSKGNPITDDWIRQTWDACGGGVGEAGFKRIDLGDPENPGSGDPAHAANYISKYLSKQMEANECGNLEVGKTQTELADEMEKKGLKKLPIPAYVKHYRSSPALPLRKKSAKKNADMEWKHMARGVKVVKQGVARIGGNGELLPVLEGWKVPDLRHNTEESGESWQIVALNYSALISQD